MGLREKQSEERKQRILNVADTLIRSTGGIEFSMRTLAEMAEVSPATPYNLFGSKDGVLSASLARSLKKLVTEGLALRSDAALEFIVIGTQAAVDRLVGEKELLRPLYQYLLGVVDPLHRPGHIRLSLHYWRTVAETGVGSLQRDEELQMIDLDTLTYLLFAHFLGLLELWIHKDIEDEAFRSRAVYGSLLVVHRFVPSDQAETLQTLLAAAKAGLETTLKPKTKRTKVAKPHE